MDLDVNLREEAPSHGLSSSAGGPAAQQPSSSISSSSSSTGAREALDEEHGGRGIADDQRARGSYAAGFPADQGSLPSDAHQRVAAYLGLGQEPTYTPPGHEPATTPTAAMLMGTAPSMADGKTALPELTASDRMPGAGAPVPLQPRPTYAQLQAAVGGGAGGGMGVPLRPASGKARSNSWSYPASAVAPYSYPYSSSSSPPASPTGGGAMGGGTGMPAPGGAPRANRYRQRGGSLSFSSPDEAMRHQYLQQQQPQQPQQPQMFLSFPPQPTQQQPTQQQQQQDSFMYGGGDGGFLSAYQQSRQPQTAQPTPPLPTTPSSFIRRTSLPQTYLHTIPIARSVTSSGFTPATTDTALPITAQPQTTEVPQKLEIPTHGARALPKEIATHPAIQSITKSQSDSAQATGQAAAAAEKELGVEITGEEEETGAVQAGEGKFVDISEYLNLPQSKVAKTLGIPSSTLSKRWKEAARARKWPWRTVCKIDKEIMALLHNIPPSVAAKGPEHVPPEIHTRLLALLKQRQDELKPVIIRL